MAIDILLALKKLDVHQPQTVSVRYFGVKRGVIEDSYEKKQFFTNISLYLRNDRRWA